MMRETMSKRSRLWAALKRERTDRIPWAPLICGYYTYGLPEPLRGDDIATQRAIGCDVLERYALTYSPALFLGIPRSTASRQEEEAYRVGAVHVKTVWKEGYLSREFSTPVGSIRDVFRADRTSPWMMFPLEHKVKSFEDMRVYRYLIESQHFVPNYDYFLKVSREVGEEGIAATVGPITPFESLLEVDIGIANFYYLLSDHTAEVEQLMGFVHRKNLEACKMVAQSPAEVVISYENTSTTNMSPKMFARYIIGDLNEYADICHQASKVLLVHMCGKLKALAEMIGDGRYDGIVDIAPPPTGDMNLAEAKQAWGEGKIVMGGIDATSFVFCDPQQIKELVWEQMDRLPSHGGVILGSGDAVPLGTPLENLQAVTEAVREYALR